MCADVHMDMHADMRVDMRINGACAQTRVQACTQTCHADTCARMCTDMCTDMPSACPLPSCPARRIYLQQLFGSIFSNFSEHADGERRGLDGVGVGGHLGKGWG